MKQQYIITTLIIFAALSGAFFALKIYAPEYNFVVLEAGNVIMAGLTLASFFIINKQMDRPQAFVRGVSGASFLKLMACMISVLVYALLNRQHIHKPSVFVLLGIYVIYTAMETWLLSKLVRK